MLHRTVTSESTVRPQSNVKQTVPFLHVADMSQSLSFYVDGLGFEVLDSWVVEGAIRWCWLRLGGAALMLQEFPTEGQGAWVPTCKVGEGVSLYFICDDALAVYHDVKARGITTSEPSVGNNMWVIELTDPDGYCLAFESDTEVPEGTSLSEWAPDADDRR